MNKVILLLALLFSLSNTQFTLQAGQAEEFETCYGLIFDAGSSSTKMQIYEWPCSSTQSPPEINTQDIPSEKAKPGIATFADDLSGIEGYLQPLIDKANDKIPEKQRSSVPIILFGTAGLRLIPEKDQKNILETVRVIFEKSGYMYNYDWVQVIPGQEEGEFMWISVNYLLGRIDDTPQSRNLTAATIDLGGASTQIAFGPNYEVSKDQNVLIDFPDYNEYDIYSVSYLGYGNDQIRNTVITKYGSWNSDKTEVTTPCYYKGYKKQSKDYDNATIIGTGKPDECLKQITQTFNLDKCSYIQKVFGCGLNGVYQPYVPEEKAIYAVSGVATAASFFKMSEPYKIEDLQKNYKELCAKKWTDIEKEYPDNPYIDTTCFLGLYSTQLMVAGYNLPRTREVHSPTEIDNVEPSWTLGAMFYIVAQMPVSEEQTSIANIAKSYLSKIDENKKQQKVKSFLE